MSSVQSESKGNNNQLTVLLLGRPQVVGHFVNPSTGVCGQASTFTTIGLIVKTIISSNYAYWHTLYPTAGNSNISGYYSHYVHRVTLKLISSVGETEHKVEDCL